MLMIQNTLPPRVLHILILDEPKNSSVTYCLKTVYVLRALHLCRRPFYQTITLFLTIIGFRAEVHGIICRASVHKAFSVEKFWT